MTKLTIKQEKNLLEILQAKVGPNVGVDAIIMLAYDSIIRQCMIEVYTKNPCDYLVYAITTDRQEFLFALDDNEKFEIVSRS